MCQTDSTTTSDTEGIAWWNDLSETERRYWLNRAESARPVDAYRAYCDTIGVDAPRG